MSALVGFVKCWPHRWLILRHSNGNPEGQSSVGIVHWDAADRTDLPVHSDDAIHKVSSNVSSGFFGGQSWPMPTGTGPNPRWACSISVAQRWALIDAVFPLYFAKKDCQLMVNFDHFQRYVGRADPQVPVAMICTDRVIHRFFDSSPVSPSGRYAALFRFPQESRSPQPGEEGSVILVDLQTRRGSVDYLHEGIERVHVKDGAQGPSSCR